MPFRPNDQLALLEGDFDPIATLRQSLTKKAPWSSIIEFATSDRYCGQSLYPRQQTLLRLIYLETEQMTDYDHEVIDGWRTGFEDRIVCGVQPDIWHRVEYLKRRGYRRFPHIQAVLGRRASKGFIGAILGAEQIAYLIAMDNPQKNFNIREGKSVFLNVGATSKTQAQRQLFADVREVVQDCEWLQPYIAENKDHQLRLRTPADIRRLARLKSQGLTPESLIASLWAVPLSASSTVGRGATSYTNMFDEFAFHVQGTGSVKSGDEIYEDWQPSLGQFKKDALTYVPSSPFTKVGKFYELYNQGRVWMRSYEEEVGIASQDARSEIAASRMRADLDEVELEADPTMLIIQGPSWAQPVTTPVLTPHGWRSMGELTVGDFVIGADGHPTKITGVVRPGVQPAYRIVMNDGSSTRCSAGHLWRIEDWNERAGTMRSRGTVVATEQIAALLPGDPKHPRTFIPMVSSPPVFDAPDDLSVPAYLLGYLLGDGCLRVNNSPRIALTEPEQNALIEQSLWEKFPEMKLVFHSGADWGIVSGYRVPEKCLRCEKRPTARELCPTHYHQAKISGEFEGQFKKLINPLGQALQELGLMGVLGPNKFVPECYLISSPDQRLSVLQGLMDSDGTYSSGKHSAIFFTTSPELARAVIQLAESLGGQGRMYARKRRTANCLPSWHVSVRLPGDLNPFRMNRKAQAYVAGVKQRRRAVPVRKIVSVEPDGQEEMQCIEVAAEDGLYVTEHYIVTHNCLYEDFERGAELTGFQADFAPENDLRDEEQQRRRRKNPEKFAVERLGQFAEVLGQYLDSAKVEAMFRPVEWRDPSLCSHCDDDGLVSQGRHAGQPCLHPLSPSPFGRFDYTYRIHVDPSSVDANFALAIAHTEAAPPDQNGQVWPHVIIDRLHVWQASDFPENPETGKREIDQTQVEREISELLYAFPSTSIFSSDQWNCVKQDTLISTKQGLLTIEELAGSMHPGEIRPEAMVVRSRGSEQIAAQVYRKGMAATRRFTTWSGAQIECTPDHRLWVRRENKEGWRRAGTITEGDELILQRGGVFPEAPALLDGGARRTSAKMLCKTEVDEEVAAFLGYMVSEGYLGPDASFRFCQKDLEVIEDFCALSESILGRRPAQAVRSFTSTKGVVTQNTTCQIHSIPLARALGYVQQPSIAKATPLAIRRSPRKVVTAYLSALFEGDGGVTPDGVSYWSLSEQLVRETQQLLLMVGIFSRIRCYRPSRTMGTHPRWVLTASGPEAIRFCEEIGFRSSRKRQQAQEYVARLRAGRTLGAKRARFLEGEEIRESITRIERSRAQCYDLSVPVTECYIANGFVSHNSVGFLQRLRKKYAPNIRVIEVTATEKVNWERAEKFKSAINLGWVHSYADKFYDDGKGSLLEQECKFLSEKNGKVYKQEFGPVQTKDLYDAVSTVVVDLLAEALERWDSGTMTASAQGSTNVAGLRSGRERERVSMAAHGAAHQPGNGLYKDGLRQQKDATKAWERLEESLPSQHRRSQYFPARTRAIGTNRPTRRMP